MAQFERGGMNLGRWPAEGDADLPHGAEDEAPGVISDLASDDQQRLSQLPAHETDNDDSFGGGVMSTGGSNIVSGFDEEAAGQPVPEEEGTPGALSLHGRDADDSGLPLGGGTDKSGDGGNL